MSDDATDSPPPRPRRRYGLERNLVGALFLAIISAIIVNGAVIIWHDTYRQPDVAPPGTNCSDGIALLYNHFQMLLIIARPTGQVFVPRIPVQDRAEAHALEVLDDQLLALRPVCEREGRDALSAFDSLTLWRHRAEDLARVNGRLLTPDAERALRYHSPGTNP